MYSIWLPFEPGYHRNSECSMHVHSGLRSDHQ